MFEISQEILSKAMNCDRNFDCLSDPSGPNCEANGPHLRSDSCFIKELKRNCPYHINFGYEPVCTCPVRSEIYRKYGM